MSALRCSICPHGCLLSPGQTGLCRARKNENGAVCSINYGLVTSLCLDPIEKKPLRRFFPGSMVLSVGSFGCNLRCSFCQNHQISMAEKQDANCVYISPHELVRKAAALVPKGNIGLAFTYNEPLIGYEYVRDCAELARQEGLKTVLVTNGFINEEPLLALLPFIDAMNIDLKSFTPEGYRRIAGGLPQVQRTIVLSASSCHVEVTTLIVPGENDTEEEMRALSAWLCGVDRRIPLHISRFFPRYQMADRAATPVSTVLKMAEIARQSLDFVYVGNVTCSKLGVALNRTLLL